MVHWVARLAPAERDPPQQASSRIRDHSLHKNGHRLKPEFHIGYSACSITKKIKQSLIARRQLFRVKNSQSHENPNLLPNE